MMGTLGLLLILASPGAAERADAGVARDLPLRPSGPGISIRADGFAGRIVNHVGFGRCARIDADGDGQDDLLTGGSFGWAVLESDPLHGGLRARHLHEVPGDRAATDLVVQVAAHEVTGDAREDVVVLLAGGVLEIHDAATGDLVSRRSLELTGEPVAFALAGTGPTSTVLVTGDGGLDAFRLDAPGLAWTIPGSDGFDVAILQADADPGLEAAVARGDDVEGHVVDLVSQSVQWRATPGFGKSVACGDLDGDGLEDVLSANRYGATAADSPSRGVRLWSVPSLVTLELAVADIDGDGRLEAVRADANRFFEVLDGSTGAHVLPILPLAYLPYGVNGLAVGDFDHDCHLDIAMVLDASTTSENLLTLYQPDAENVTWQSTGAEGAFGAVLIADVNGGGLAELVALEGGHEDADVGVTIRNVPLQSLVASAPAGVGASAFAAGQLDADPQLELVRAGGSGWVALDGISLAPQATGPFDPWLSSLAAADLDGDGLDEIIVGEADYTVPANPPRVSVFAASGGPATWATAPFPAGDEITSVGAQDLDGDGTPEIVALSVLAGVIAWDAATHVQELSLPVLGGAALAVADVDGDGDLDAVVGLDAGGLEARDLGTGGLVYSVPGDRVFALRLADLDGDGTDELIDLTGPVNLMRVQVRSLDGEALWESDAMPGGPSSYYRQRMTSLLDVGDVDGDGRIELAVACDGSIRWFEAVEGSPDSEPPVFAGVRALSRVPSPACCPAVDVSWDPALDGAHPPVAYDVYRGATADFLPDPASWLVRVEGLSYRDGDVLPDSQLHYLVRAVDARGNSDQNLVRASVRTTTTWPPEAPTCTAADAQPCARDGVSIAFLHAGLPEGITFDLAVDGVPRLANVTSPVRWRPPDARTHDYAVTAVHPACRMSVTSASSSAADLGGTASAPLLDRAADVDPCSGSGVRIEFSHPDGPLFAGTFDLMVDGVVAAASVASPVVHLPSDALPHVYRIRARTPECGAVDSAPVVVRDAAGPVAPPVPLVLDADDCARGAVVVTFDASTTATQHVDLWRDGAPFLARVTSGLEFDPGDDLAHDHALVTVDDACGTSARGAAASPFRDRPEAPAVPSAPAFTDVAPCSPSAVVVRVTHPGFADGGRLELWRDGSPYLIPVTDGTTFVPGTAEASWSVVARSACGEAVEGPALAFADGTSSAVPPRILAIEDADACASGSMRLRLAHPGFVGAGHLELLRDGAAWVSPVRDGDVVATGGPGAATWTVRAVDETCGTRADSAPEPHDDALPAVIPPVLLSLTDEEGCARTGMTIRFTPATFPSAAGRHDLYMDGGLVAGSVADGDRAPAPDSLVHSWSLLAVDGSCALQAASNVVAAADEDRVCAVGRSTVRVTRSAVANDVRLDWTPAEDAARYHAYVGTLASLRSGIYDHVPAMAGVGFPDAVDPSSGCDVASGQATTARVTGLPAEATYVLLVPHGLDGNEGSHGLRSVAPFERRDVDPRPPSAFCP